MMFEGRFSEGLSLVDAVMPDVVLAKQKQLRDKIAAEKLKADQESQAVESEKNPNTTEDMATNGGEQTSNATASDSSATAMTTTVVTAATSTTTIKQESQANGEVLHGRISAKFLLNEILNQMRFSYLNCVFSKSMNDSNVAFKII